MNGQEEQNQAALAKLQHEQLPQILRLQGDAQANTYRNQVLNQAAEELVASRGALRVAREALEDTKQAFVESQHFYRAGKIAEAIRKIKELMGEK